MVEVEAEVPAPEPLEADVELAERSWADINTAPRDGTLVEYEEGKFARFRVTRRRDTEARRWMTVGFWADAFTATEVTPEKFRLPEGFVMPGLVV